MSLVAGLPPLVAPAASTDIAREKINVLPTPKYDVPSFTPSSFPEDGRGIQPQPRFQSSTRVADSAAETKTLGHLSFERGDNA